MTIPFDHLSDDNFNSNEEREEERQRRFLSKVKANEMLTGLSRSCKCLDWTRAGNARSRDDLSKFPIRREENGGGNSARTRGWGTIGRED